MKETKRVDFSGMDSIDGAASSYNTRLVVVDEQRDLFPEQERLVGKHLLLSLPEQLTLSDLYKLTQRLTGLLDQGYDIVFASQVPVLLADLARHEGMKKGSDHVTGSVWVLHNDHGHNAVHGWTLA